MTDYERGDIVLVPYPFGEWAGARKRPALVVSSAEYNQATGELIIAQITSRMSAPPRPGDHPIEGWKEASLPRPAMVRSRLATLETSLVVRHLGTLSQADLKAVQENLSSLIGA